MHLKAVKKKNLSPWKLLYHWQLLWHWPRRRVRAKCDGPTRFIASHLWMVTFTSSSHVLPAGAQTWKHMKADNTVYFYTCRKMKTLSLPRSNTILWPWCILFCSPPPPFSLLQRGFGISIEKHQSHLSHSCVINGACIDCNPLWLFRV